MAASNSSTLQWSDSEIARVEARPCTDVWIIFSAASTGNGQGYVKGVTLKCHGVTSGAAPHLHDWVGGIRHGQVLTPGGKQASMPLPGHIKGPLHLSFTLMNGTEINIDAKELTAILPDNPEWTESLAC